MQKFFTSLRAVVAVSAATLLFYACKKSEQNVDLKAEESVVESQCVFCPQPACDIRTLLVSPGNDTSWSVHYPQPFKFTKTYGADGRVNFLDAYSGAHWSFHEFRGPVYHEAKKVFMLNEVGDTLLVAKLNSCNQPVSAVIYKRFPGEAPWATEYHKYAYDYKGRLSKLSFTNDPAVAPSVNVYQYDWRDNVVKIYLQGDASKNIKYTYDYSKPIKGGIYEQGIDYGIGTQLLEMLGYVNTQPHNLLKTVSNNYNDPKETWSYFDQVVDSNKFLISYKANLYNNATVSVKGELVWKCGKGGDSTAVKF
jgi:hypothetical protein